MKYFLLFILFVFFQISALAQDSNILKLMEKLKAGKELTKSEEQEMEKWIELQSNQSKAKASPEKSKIPAKSNSGAMCPKEQATKPQITPLTSTTYITLAKSLMTVYGPKMGIKVSELNNKLEGSKKSTNGADMGVLFMTMGAGSATIYSTAWSAARNPTDVLTANNLGVALKDMGDYPKALQVLLYAKSLNQGVPLIYINLGWVYREMGNAADAKLMFERALQLAPELPSPHLGLGLLAECAGSHTVAIQHLRKALAGRTSAAGIAAYKKAQESQSNSNNNQSVSSEKGEVKEFNIPELPVYEQKGKMEQAEATLNAYSISLSSRINDLHAQAQSLFKIIEQQNEKARQNPENSIVFARDFSKELFLFQDVHELLWGKSSNWSRKTDEANKLLEQIQTFEGVDLETQMQIEEKMNKLGEKEISLRTRHLKDFEACGNIEPCQDKVNAKLEADLVPINTEREQLEYRLCKLQKGDMEVLFSRKYKAWKLLSNELETTGRDYYSFTNPILEKIYAPSLNELQNVYRELAILDGQVAVLAIASELPAQAANYNQLKCVEPEPPRTAGKAEDPKLPKKEKAPCPLGENGISGGAGAISFELSCEHFKLSGGEGLLWSVKRDFDRHETTIWGGVGATAEYGNGNLSGEATVGVEVTIGQGDVIKDVALTSSVKAGLGGLVEGEVSGRFSVEGGPSMEATGGIITPEIPGI